MRLSIAARLADEDGDTAEGGEAVLAVIERPAWSLDELWLTLAEGRSMLAKVRAKLISKQVHRWLSGRLDCQNCGAALCHKDSRSTVLRTVYGQVTVKSPRGWSCTCHGGSQMSRRVVHPLSQSADGARHSRTRISPGEMGGSAGERSGFYPVRRPELARRVAPDCQSEGKTPTLLPLPLETGRAIADYLRFGHPTHGKPRTICAPTRSAR